MNFPRQRLGEMLINLRLITPDQLESALEVQRESAAPVGTILVSLGFVAEEQVLNALAAQYGVSPWRLDESKPHPEVLDLLPLSICRQFQILPLRKRGDLLTLGMRNPLDIDGIDIARNLTGMRVEPVLVDEGRLARALEDIASGAINSGRMDGFVTDALSEASAREGKGTIVAELNEEDTRPVVGLVNQILSDAIRMGASDVHIEPRKDKTDIRYRLDGLLRKVKDVPSNLHPMLSTRLKIMANMDIVEHRVPQDGRVTATIDGRLVDLRVSTLPNQYGQRFVLRILDKSKGLKKLEELGFTAENLHLFNEIIRRPYGICLVTGPTGSGKTTTLYAALQELRNGTNNIMTCEDPIEYEIEGINQSQVQEKVGLTFAAQLRATLRQDPDIILVGEIRDQETAQTAIRAALTGHLVLSTLHCNDAPSAIPRLLDMGVDPFLLSTSLIGVMSQRLIRTTCTTCKGTKKTSQGRCGDCTGTGFKGRTAVHEILPITSGVSAAIGSRLPMEAILHAGYAGGYKPMEVWAESLVRKGITTREEARRQIQFTSDSSAFHVKLAA